MGYINQDMARFLNNDYPRMFLFYILLKVNKPGHPPPGRTIISGTDSALRQISKLLDFFRQPLVTSAPSFIKDTKAFIAKV